MSQPQPAAKYRKDYRPPDFQVDRVDLDFELEEEQTVVRARLAVRRNPQATDRQAPLRLNGEQLELLELKVDGAPLPAGRFQTNDEGLLIPGLPESSLVETAVRINPKANTELSGLYTSSGNFCTQCEAEGFRRITYFPDRPDVMARYSTRISADRARYPVLLSNGNRVAEGEAPGGRHWVRWEDPFPKPCYLFALVAGNLKCHAGTFTTRSGRVIRLEIWVEPQNIDRCAHALRSLQEAMKWDEESFGLEYDLDTYMIVAVNDFNMGAMENKGLNIFNSKLVFARPDTATDDDYEAIQSVIAHEYFHNWTGNRVTCRDWFQLTLKEGLTVFRDQLFGEDLTSRAVKRIAEIRSLRLRQFPEDAGPMAHPIRPESYIAMDNFYTATVYEKGAEVIRMYATLLGRAGFRKGMDLYFQRHDGQAVTCDDFRAAMADANGVDLTQFERWYTQAGTPQLEAQGAWDAASRTYRLTLRQRCPKTQDPAAWKPLPIPVALGLIGPAGQDLPLRLQGEDPAAPQPLTRVLQLKQEEASFVFTGIPANPQPSLLRDYSAPVKLRIERSRRELAALMAHDSDPFNRWDAGQTLSLQLMLELAAQWRAGKELTLDPLLSEAFGRILQDTRLDGSLKALALSLPAEDQLAQEQEVIDTEALHEAREFLLRALARTHRATLFAEYRAGQASGPYRHDKASIDRRRLKNAALRYLSVLEEPETIALAANQFRQADNMTDAQAALVSLTDTQAPEREEALGAFYEKWRQDPVVLDKWFGIQAVSQRTDTLARVQTLMKHPDFTLRNPNRLRALVGSFCAGNHVRFHQADGGGYVFLGDLVLQIDPLNPQIASRLAAGFNQWKRYDQGRKRLMQAQLERIIGAKGLSKDCYEVVGKALGR